jgi:Spy/CpxP family protein refolding chaperone
MAAWQQEVTKAVLAAIATTIATQIASFLAVLADPNSPSRILSDGRKTMDFVEAWGKTSEQIQKLPKSQLRDDAQAEIDDLLQKYQVGRESYAAIYQQRRATLLRILVFLRLSGLRGGYRRVAAFFFYIAVVLLIQ